MTRQLSLSLLALLVLISGCTQATSSKHPMASDGGNREVAVTKSPEPAALKTVAEQGEDMYDSAKETNWQKAHSQLTLLQGAETKLPATPPYTSQLQQLTTGLAQDIAKHDKLAVMQNANQVTLLVTKLLEPYPSPVPEEVSLMDYYGRALEIGSALQDTTKLKTTTADMKQAWKTLQPKVEAHGGTKEAQTFNQLIQQVGNTKSPKEYKHLASQVLDEVDNLEKVFES